MELQNKFENTIKDNIDYEYCQIKSEVKLAKQCTILCLEEQINEFIWTSEQCENIRQFKASILLKNKVEELQQQLKLLKDE